MKDTPAFGSSSVSDEITPPVTLRQLTFSPLSPQKARVGRRLAKPAAHEHSYNREFFEKMEQRVSRLSWDSRVAQVSTMLSDCEKRFEDAAQSRRPSSPKETLLKIPNVSTTESTEKATMRERAFDEALAQFEAVRVG